jgi:uncharacterized membrane protein YdjX (TVP38/TMEM64 family)
VSHAIFRAMAPTPPSTQKAKAWRSLIGAFVTFGGVGLLFLFGAKLLGLDGASEVRLWLASVAGGPWALPATVAIFALLAFLGAPQVVLIAAAVLALGPWAGMSYSWAGTMVSSVIGFGLGRRFGEGLLREWAGPRVVRFVELITRNGFAASLLIRLAPAAPFIFVNMAAGVAQVGLFDFVAGTAIGIVPKIVLTALAGRSMQGLAGGDGRSGLVLALAAAIWVALSLAGYVWIKRRDGQRAG